MKSFGIFKGHSRFALISGIIIAIMLLVLEITVGVQYFMLSPRPPIWGMVLLVACEFALDVLFVTEIFVDSFPGRIAFYCADFVLLLFISALCGSPYIVALYCVILTQFYINVEEFKYKLTVFIISCALFLVTFFTGRALNLQLSPDYGSILSAFSDGLLNLLILFAHFAVVNFLVSFYSTNKKLTAALKESDENKKMLEEAYKQLSETAVYEERNRIARDIHDNAGHSMTAVIMQTEAAKLIIDSNPEEAKSRIIAANIQAKNALEQMRESVHLLAGRNASFTLKEELEEIVAQTMDGTGITVRYDIADISLPYVMRRFFANSLKECLANGMRHGGATAFYVELAYKDGLVVLTVSDNGTGLREDFKEGFGLKGIREKAVSFGGSIVLESEEGEGAEIKITIPLEDEGEENK